MILDAKYLATPYRCAVYFVPDPASAWWQAGSQWLGRCAATGQSMAQPTLAGIAAADQWAATAEPRRYGWHATLKAPFKIMAGENLKSVMTALHDLAKTLPAFDLPALHISTEGGFMALRPKGDVSQIKSTAAACVTAMHRFAQPLSEADLARRRLAPLTPEQDQLLLQWGYPYVLDAFEFHLSLTGRLDGMGDADKAAWQQAAQSHFAHLPMCRFDRLALFVEPERGADFQLFDQVALGV
jgi:putative phosphonate metabolism protein